MLSVNDIKGYKRPRAPLVCLTAYTTSVARIVDSQCDIILVGDSVGMTVYGMDTTQTVTMDMMVNHGRAVRRGCQNALLVVDMPYGSYEHGLDEALFNAKRIMSDTQCDAVKLEGGAAFAPVIAHLTAAGIPVMGHIGLLPQSFAAGDVFKIQGKTDEAAQVLLADALAVQNAGAFSVVIEGTIEPVAAMVTAALSIPTIGIGASAACDGQILVSDDLFGLNPKPAKFVKTYADVASVMSQAVEVYAADVRAGTFPTPAHVYQRKT
jgi:3-methyl-2-oxobutanoate hydroxymethyltransferase